ncbi:winged helix-turn-helix transcriptional regulator [Alicyclobacillus curvatus]|nr:winged helix-turn-helix transcriptional regulator [Alicyclobacillus curvatus]
MLGDCNKNNTCTTEIPRIHRGEIPLLEGAQVRAVTSVAKALADPIRVQMVYLLSRNKDLCTCEFEEILELSQSKVSYHLKQLLDAGIVKREIHGSWSHYRLVDNELLNYLEICNVLVTG